MSNRSLTSTNSDTYRQQQDWCCGSDWTIEIVVQETPRAAPIVYNVHREKLVSGAVVSNYFVGLLETESLLCSKEHQLATSRIVIPRASANMFPILLDYLYYGKPKPGRSIRGVLGFLHLYILQDYLGIDGLRKSFLAVGGEHCLKEKSFSKLCALYSETLKHFPNDPSVQEHFVLPLAKLMSSGHVSKEQIPLLAHVGMDFAILAKVVHQCDFAFPSTAMGTIYFQRTLELVKQMFLSLSSPSPSIQTVLDALAGPLEQLKVSIEDGTRKASPRVMQTCLMYLDLYDLIHEDSCRNKLGASQKTAIDITRLTGKRRRYPLFLQACGRSKESLLECTKNISSRVLWELFSN